MKILKFDEFIKLPKGTIYSYYEPCLCVGLYRKGDSIKHPDGIFRDYFEASVVPFCEQGDDPVVDGIEGRWALFEYDQLYAVFDADDIMEAVSMLTSSLDSSPSERDH